MVASCSSFEAGATSPSATSSGSRSEPTSTRVMGHPLRSSSIWVDDHSALCSIVPSDRAPPTGPQGATALTQRSPAAAVSPSRPSWVSKRSRAAASSYSGHSVTLPSTTAGGAVHGRSAGSGSSPGRSAAARPPAESPSQPSAGHVFEYTERTDRAADDPSRRSSQRFGVVCSSTSDQLIPPVPMTHDGARRLARGGVGRPGRGPQHEPHDRGRQGDRDGEGSAQHGPRLRGSRWRPRIADGRVRGRPGGTTPGTRRAARPGRSGSGRASRTARMGA